ncbi:MAG: O-antigen ligase family protein [bacterium]|nr:O-antigen ligase family protein [bacterium]
MWRLSLSHFPSALFEGAAILAVFSIPFGTRSFFGSVTPGFDEYESFFLYTSDIAVLLFLALLTIKDRAWLPRILGVLPKAVTLGAALMLLGAALSVFFAPSLPLAIYAFARLALGLFFAAGLAAAISQRHVPPPFLLGALAVSGVFQALLAFLQFRAQGSIGLSLLGEPLLGPRIGGAAKIIVEGGALLRGYGTLPHPNVLAAVLIVALLALSYFWLRRPGIRKMWQGGAPLWSDVLLGIALFVVAIGLALTFSRSGWLAACAATALLVFGAFLMKEFRIQAARLFFLLLTIFYLLSVSMGWAIFPRATLTREEPAVAYRLRYNDLGLELVKRNPLGVGIGNQVLHAVARGTYLEFGMRERWQWQPIHNIYLLVATEVGLLGALGFIVMLGAVLWHGILRFLRRGAERLPIVVALTALAALLALGFADHYLWTLQSGRLLLWSVLGILLGLISPHSSTDRA